MNKTFGRQGMSQGQNGTAGAVIETEAYRHTEADTARLRLANLRQWLTEATSPDDQSLLQNEITKLEKLDD